MASIKGKLFEYLVFRLLLSCGFKPVIPDGLLVYNGGPGLMVQGIGQPHNADVLLSPPIQTPFYYPTRLIVECKCYNEPIGLPPLRNALGLREDINNFEIVTKDILKRRKHYRAAGAKFYDMKRYVYQVAVASIDGFKSTAFPFAKAHRIPLISFGKSRMFAGVRDSISDLDKLASKNNQLANEITSYINRFMLNPKQNAYENLSCCEEYNTYIEEIEKIEHLTTIGLLEDGTIIFLLRQRQYEEKYLNSIDSNYEDGCTIHWYESHDDTWILRDHGKIYSFELPKEIYDSWEHYAGKQRRDAVRIKRDYFSKIVMFNREEENRENISILHLSERFMKEAEESIERDEKRDFGPQDED